MKHSKRPRGFALLVDDPSASAGVKLSGCSHTRLPVSRGCPRSLLTVRPKDPVASSPWKQSPQSCAEQSQYIVESPQTPQTD